MWNKLLFLVILFYFIALLQNSFLAHFALFGAVPNLVLIFFSLAVFFGDKDSYYFTLLLATATGVLLDIFFYSCFGPSVFALLALGFLLKKIKLSLKNGKDHYPLLYYLPIFFVFFIGYAAFIGLYLRFFDPNSMHINFTFKDIFVLIYNLFVAYIFFSIYKKINEILPGEKSIK